MNRFWRVFALLLLPSLIQAQGNQVSVNELGGQRNPITVAVPFLAFAPDSRGSALGDAGVATSPDAYSVHWNNAKLAFIDKDFGASISYSPWLRNIAGDMALIYLTGYKKINRDQAVAFGMRYFDLGEIQLTDVEGNPLGVENPREFSFDATYSRKLSERLSIAATGRFISSNIAGNATGAPDVNVGNSIAVDVGVFYQQPLALPSIESTIAFGAHISNLGQKITYTNESNEDFIPANFRIGGAWTGKLDPYNSLTFALDFNKLLVPTPPEFERDANGNIAVDANGDRIIADGKDPDRPLLSGTFGSFSDAPGGFSEELKEITISIGAEYWYRDIFAARIGYFHEAEDKGNRKYFSAGIGLRYQVFGLDLSYLIPPEQNHPLGDTLRISLLFNFDKKEDESL